jgi:hypothetical protein
MTHSKPYFLPLYKEYYLKIKNGEQNCEIKPFNHRGWNSKNIYPLRELNVSNGYQKPGRIIKRIYRVDITNDLKKAYIPQWHIDAVEAIYGKRDLWMVASF